MNNNTAESLPQPPAEVGAENDHETPADPSTGFDWKTELASRWEALGREVLGREQGARRKLREMMDDCASLIVVTAWFESQGNITHAAERLGSSRRALRGRIVVWRREHPNLLPRRPDTKPTISTPKVAKPGMGEPKANKPRRRKRGRELEPVIDAGEPTREERGPETEGGAT